MKNAFLTTGLLAGLTGASLAGTPVAPVAAPDAFADAIIPMTNPTLSGSALPQTNLHAIYMHHKLPNQVSTAVGDVDLGGDVNVLAVQLEYALTPRFSLIATKDGYIDFNPDNTLPDQEGFANLAAGVKYAFIYDEPNQLVVSGSAVVEVPTGNRDVFQGYGDGAVNLIVSALKLEGKWQFSGATGVHLPFDSHEESTTAFLSSHVSYRLTDRITPLVELNWFRVLEAGDGEGAGLGQLLEFDGLDVMNFGSRYGGRNRDTVTAAAGVRYKLSDCIDLGAAYEIPLTDENDGLTDSRFTFDVVWKF